MDFATTPPIFTLPAVAVREGSLVWCWHLVSQGAVIRLISRHLAGRHIYIDWALSLSARLHTRSGPLFLWSLFHLFCLALTVTPYYSIHMFHSPTHCCHSWFFIYPRLIVYSYLMLSTINIFWQLPPDLLLLIVTNVESVCDNFDRLDPHDRLYAKSAFSKPFPLTPRQSKGTLQLAAQYGNWHA